MPVDIIRIKQLAGIPLTESDFNFEIPNNQLSQTGQSTIGNVTTSKNIEDKKPVSSWGDQSDDIQPNIDGNTDGNNDTDALKDTDSDKTTQLPSGKVKISKDTTFNVLTKDPTGKFAFLAPDGVDEPSLGDIVVAYAADLMPIGESIIYKPVPKKVLDSLKKAIKEQKENEKLFKEKDDRASLDFASNLRKAMEVVLSDMEEGTEEGMKRAQIDLNKLMTPMVFLFPQDVRNHIANGGKTNEFSDKFKLFDVNPFADKGSSSNNIGSYEQNSGGSKKHDA